MNTSIRFLQSQTHVVKKILFPEQFRMAIFIIPSEECDGRVAIRNFSGKGNDMKKFGGFLGNAFDEIAYLANLQTSDITSNEHKTIKFDEHKTKTFKSSMATHDNKN